MTVNGVNVNESVTFTKVTDNAIISLSTEKIGVGPLIVIRAVGGGEKKIGSKCNISTTAEAYIDEKGNISYPKFYGWWKGETLVSTDVYYSFTVTGNALFLAKWSWN